MKNARLMILTVIALIGTSAAISRSNTAATIQTIRLSRQQMAHLFNTANTPEGHHQLAHYFRQEAQHKRDEEQRCREMVGTYHLHTPRVDAYRNESIQARYERLADEARNEAFACEQQANFQDKLAKVLAAAK